MTDWTSGYVSDISYTYGYYPELQPNRLRLAFLERGVAAPTVANACELGFGQGISVNVHAAASNVKWWGTDFNPTQAAFAQELAAVSGAGAQLFDQSFEDFCSRTDLPDFDYIGLHGIWSWISDANRTHIANFVARKLRPGGVLYVSYNVLPGWAQMVPMRHLLTRHADMLSAPADKLVQRIDRSLEFADTLLQLKPAYAKAHPAVADRITQMRKHNRHYLAHEYFNRDWLPMHFLDMADWMHRAKLDFACSAQYFDLVEPVNYTQEQSAFLKGLPDPMFREAVRDFMVNAQFRRDFWVKGLRPVPPMERTQNVKALRLLLSTRRDAVTLKAATPLGEAALNEDVYGPVLDALASRKPVTVAQVEKEVEKKKVTFGQLMQAILILAGKGDLQVVQDDKVTAKAKPQCERLNRHIMGMARAGGDITTLASPVTGTGVSVGRFEQLFLLARQEGAKTPQQMAQHALDAIHAQGQRLMREGKAVDDDAESLAHLVEQAKKFEADALPTLVALQVA
ncbi:class I SAM-dependent methyltransferase [Ramlibacter albus]|uniref:Methyltransferase regulatory domain-containing protein n=1 Tax=Ramlibacter albus TaxID=2079448 RepID=A0A923M3L7_9BURK|nr:class I SAM-dependent methyltransferase [Ramlibacter albus]MBC5763320.1 methyltransferase regulatory domain-containing protein [Ramlibacter albus]